MRSDIELSAILKTSEIQSDEFHILCSFYMTEEESKGRLQYMMKITVVSAWYWVSTVQVGD